MATYSEIQTWIKQEKGVTVKTCHIAYVKSMYNLTARIAPNRHGKERVYPCPENKRVHIADAFRHFKMI